MSLYFAYGANMHGGEMAERCPEADFVSRATLAGYAFSIGAGGFGTVLPTDGGVVHGVLWTLSPDDERTLDEYEGVPEGLYTRMAVDVEQPDGERIQAFAYHAVDPTPGKPLKGYMETILAAARYHRLPPDYVATLERWMPGKAT